MINKDNEININLFYIYVLYPPAPAAAAASPAASAASAAGAAAAGVGGEEGGAAAAAAAAARRYCLRVSRDQSKRAPSLLPTTRLSPWGPHTKQEGDCSSKEETLSFLCCSGAPLDSSEKGLLREGGDRGRGQQKRKE